MQSSSNEYSESSKFFPTVGCVVTIKFASITIFIIVNFSFDFSISISNDKLHIGLFLGCSVFNLQKFIFPLNWQLCFARLPPYPLEKQGWHWHSPYSDKLRRKQDLRQRTHRVEYIKLEHMVQQEKRLPDTSEYTRRFAVVVPQTFWSNYHLLADCNWYDELGRLWRTVNFHAHQRPE